MNFRLGRGTILAFFLCALVADNSLIGTGAGVDQSQPASAETGALAEALVKAGPAERDSLLARNTSLKTPDLVRALVSACRNLMSEGTNTEALDVCRLAHRIAEEIGSDAARGSALNAIGVVHELQDDLPQALEYYERSLPFRRRAGDKDGEAATLNNMGIAYEKQGRVAEALEHYEKSIAGYKETGNALLANPYNNIGLLYYRLGDYAQALRYYRESTAQLERSGNPNSALQFAENIAMVYHAQGDDEQALSYYRKTLAFRESIGDKAGIARVLNNLGQLLSGQGLHVEALGYLQRSLALREERGDRAGIATSLNTIGLIHDDAGAYEKALEHFERSLAIRESLGTMGLASNTLKNIAAVYAKQRSYEKALQFADRAAALARQTGGAETLWRARAVAGASYRGLNQTGRARQAYDEAIEIVEELRAQVAGGEQAQQRSFESRLTPYHGLAALLVEDKKPFAAQLVAERAKSRVLLDVLHGGRVNATKAMSAAEQKREQTLADQLVSTNAEMLRERSRQPPDAARLGQIETRVRGARLALEAFQTDLYAAHPELRVRRGQAPVLTGDDVHGLLPDPQTALIEFVVTDDATLAFVIESSCDRDPEAAEPGGVCITTYRVGIGDKELTDRVEQFRGMIAAVDNRFTRASRQLYDLLLGPAAAQLRGKRAVVIVPDGILWDLPMQALQTPQRAYLIDEHVVSYAPSLTVLREMLKLRARRPAPAGMRTLLAMGNPVVGAAPAARANRSLMDELEPLPDAERQLRSLQRIYGARDSSVYVGAAAREDRFKSEAARFHILHLATHGLLDDRSPMYSQLLLTPSDVVREDGLLEARELMQLELNADIAVLSACETARGRVGKGEGMIGLTWALFVAGVPTTVVSQWKVRSDSTADLMIELHKQLKAGLVRSAGRHDVAAALRRAALKIKADTRYRHPFHWAGFIAIGAAS
jgi:CHAT domain-containing protein/tetratricopeptide (TPR) repeat protein